MRADGGPDPGRSLAAVALLGAELSQPEEMVTLRMRVSGPVGGLLVEAGADGSLRGYTHVKVMNELDECEELISHVRWATKARFRSSVRYPVNPGQRHGCRVARPRSSKGWSSTTSTRCNAGCWCRSPHWLMVGSLTARGLLVGVWFDSDREVFERIARYFEDAQYKRA